MTENKAEHTKLGRPNDYTDEIADTVCEQLEAGFSLVQICNSPKMPHRTTICRWMRNDPNFATRCAQARREQADLMDDRIVDIVNRLEIGELKPDVAKVILSALQWRAAKLAPKKYGDKKEIEVISDANKYSGKGATLSELGALFKRMIDEREVKLANASIDTSVKRLK